ncbi:hydrogenase small subunit [Anaerosinus massiliensis]|uniref:hydrogenase small subunit n=1 Tax=Massilibacillus massiliensis TaxID=1806837 RepID=UPI000B045B87|nr:hydrogenase small subunit [Massilibacillus massiliensis]
MAKLESMWDVYLRKNINRRTFVKSCVALTSIMGLSTDMLPKVIAAAERKPLPVVIWLNGHECTGCDESFIRSGTPLASDVVLNSIALEYSHTLGAGAGEPFEEHLHQTMQQYAGKYILAVEGAASLAEDGIYCMTGGKTFVSVLKEAAKNAAAIIEYGTCATGGGIQAAKPNPTGSVSISDIIRNKPIVKVPGCPPIPEVMTGVIMHYALFDKLPPLDGEGRPKQFYGNRIHDTCYRRPFFDMGMFAEKFDDAGAKAGWCLYNLGCRGPVTYNSCGNLRWWNGLSYPIQSGHGCIGCSNDNFWDEDPFYKRLPEYGPLLGDIDRIGTIAAGLTAAGVVAHGAMSVVQKKKRDAAKEEAEGKKVEE